MYDSYKLNRQIMCIDIKSFYASVEANERNLNIFKDYLIVSDPARKESAITLAITPALKAQGISSRSRVFEIPKKLLDKTIIAKPQMKKYMEISSKLYAFYTNFFNKDDIYVYSIDEVFIDVTNYLKLYKTDTFKLALAIKKQVLNEFNLHVCIGIGQNMIMAKYALDLESKKTKYEIAHWSYELIPEKLWPITKLSNTWGISRATEKRLHKLGLYSMKDIANCDLKILHREFGVVGVDLSLHANGIDPSILQNQHEINMSHKSIGQSQVLFRTYNAKDVEVVILEMILETTIKLQRMEMLANGISVHIRADKKSLIKGFTKRKKMPFYFDSYYEIKDYYLELLRSSINDNILIKHVSISVFGLTKNANKQLDLLNQTTAKRNTQKLDKALADIKQKFGKDSILLALSDTEEGNQKQRNKLLGGHNASIEDSKDK